MHRVKSPFFAFAISLAVAVGLGSHTAISQDIGNKLEDAQRALEKSKSRQNTLDQRARSLGRELGQLQQAKVTAARNIQALEAKISDLKSEVADLNTAEMEKQSLLRERQTQYAHILSAIHRLSLLPPEAVIVQPLKPGDLVRTAILLRSTVPQIESQAVQLRDDLLALSETRNHIMESRRRLEEAQLDIDRQRAKLSALFFDRSKKQSDTERARKKEAARLAALTGKVNNLRDLFRKLEADRQQQFQAKPRRKPQEPGAKKPPSEQVRAAPAATPRSISKARGKLPLPVIGRIAGRYGEIIRPGITRKGIRIETATAAQVVAPYDGKVVFAGNFRGYGKLLIIEHSEGYHSLLAGMDRIDGVPGQWLLAGEPVGIMEEAAGTKPSLYVEFRRKGQPINPLPWLVAQRK